MWQIQALETFTKRLLPPKMQIELLSSLRPPSKLNFYFAKKLLLSWNGLRFMGPCVAFDLNTAEGNCKHYFKLLFCPFWVVSWDVVYTYFRSIFGFLLAYFSPWFLTHIFDKLKSFFCSFFLKYISLKNFFYEKNSPFTTFCAAFDLSQAKEDCKSQFLSSFSPWWPRSKSPAQKGQNR